MNLLLIGSGGREHALAWKLAQSTNIDTIFVATGNSGTMLEPKVKNIALTDIELLIEFAKQNNILFTLVGPEAPLALGIVDKFREHGLSIWGPTKFCANLESSKVFAKNFMMKYNIPTAQYQYFNDSNSAKQYLQTQSLPIVIKADGLAAGKGVLVATSLNEGLNFIDDIFFHHKFGIEAGSKVVIEEFLYGTEASFIVMIDGKNILTMATSQDHKRLLNSDLGPNTGGMGAYSPAPIITKKLNEQIINDIIQPVIDGMRNEGHEYTGFLYAGLMIDTNGVAKVLEYNCRFGDPETQPIMMRLQSDLVQLIQAGLAKKLDQTTAKWEDKFAVGVVLASNGYPDISQKNDIISGVDIANQLNDVKVFHCATKLIKNMLYTDGGRVLCVVGMGINIKKAQDIAYQAINLINFNNMQYRTDIGNKAL